jgi:hypothetical protein
MMRVKPAAKAKGTRGTQSYPLPGVSIRGAGFVLSATPISGKHRRNLLKDRPIRPRV